jgi:hypothetical protein
MTHSHLKPHLSPNQALQLTATRTAFTFFHD